MDHCSSCLSCRRDRHGDRGGAATAGALGLAASAPFDRILVSADFNRMPDDLVDQLGAGGRMVAPIAGLMTVIDLREGKMQRRADAGRYSFVPLRED
ncbi:MAG: hypothetical protein ACTH8F_03500 [Microbacterium sp.]|uniref:hypothetical protein n=1 Tax=Microbacterium sp. TaxID=51671 RepID=UPI003F9446E7